MKLESTADWMAYLSHKLWELRELVGSLKHDDPRWFDLGEEMTTLEQDTETTLRMLAKRTHYLVKRARPEPPPTTTKV